MSAVILDIEDLRACRRIRDAVRQIRSENAREVARIHLETELKRARIEAHLNRIEDENHPLKLEAPLA